MHQKANSFRVLSIILILLLAAVAGNSYAQSRSRITGIIKDAQTGEPLIGANVIVQGTYLGGASDIDGRYFVINVPVGTYEVKVSMVGYTPQIVKDVIVSADRVTNLDFSLQSTVIQGQEIVITAQRDELHKEVSNTQMVVTSTQLQDASGIRQINAFLSKMPGVSESNGFLTIRGGSADQTGTMVNGLSYNNAAVGNAETSIPMSAIDQVSLLSGGYNAEYGNFRSGLINITTKSGSKDKYEGTFSFSRNNDHLKRFGEYLFSSKNPAISPFVDPSIAFIGTAKAFENDAYQKQQHPTFIGWIAAANTYNRGKKPEDQASPMDLFYVTNWMHMLIPDYAGLANLPDDIKQQIGYYDLTEEQKKLFADRHMVEGGVDWNFDGGFGGPVPFIGKWLGDATFYLSNTSSEQMYTTPVVTDRQKSYTTMATVKAHPSTALSVTYNGLWKRQLGVSPVRPAWGDAPDAANAGGFMPTDNTKYIYNHGENTYWFDPPFFPLLDQTTLMNGLTFNYVFSPKTFAELSVSYLYIGNHSPYGDNRDTTILTQIGKFLLNEVPYGKQQFGTRAVRGINYSEYVSMPFMTFRYGSKEGDLYDNSKVKQFRVKFDLASQLDDHNYIKGGIEYNNIFLQHDYWEKWNTNYYNTYEFNYQRTPSQTGLYLQDQITFDELVANVGVRMDYYYGGGGKWPSGDPFNEAMFKPQKDDKTKDTLFTYLESGRSYIWDFWEKYDQEHPGFMQPIKNFFTVSPRIGVSFPVTTESKFYFNYGHFRSNPPYYTMYQYRYRYDKNGLYDMTNPNLEPPRTISYELGIAYNFYESMIISVSGYSKDVTGEAGNVRYQTASGVLNYTNDANNRYEDIQGLEVNLSKNDNSWLSGWINFNYSLKKNGLTGKSLITDQNINNDQAGLYAGNETKSLPRPELNANITFRSPEKFGPELFGASPFGGWDLTVFASYSAGSYFTWNPLGEIHVSNNAQWPDYYMVDLKLSKTFDIAGLKANIYLDISNIFNIKVSQLSSEYAFSDDADYNNYMASLHLPLYDSPKYDKLRQANPGYYVGGNDKIGDMRSADKSYINDPNWSFWTYKQPRDIWFGMRIDF